jgi:hypothetical protein
MILTHPEIVRKRQRIIRTHDVLKDTKGGQFVVSQLWCLRDLFGEKFDIPGYRFFIVTRIFLPNEVFVFEFVLFFFLFFLFFFLFLLLLLFLYENKT